MPNMTKNDWRAAAAKALEYAEREITRFDHEPHALMRAGKLLSARDRFLDMAGGKGL